MNETEEMINIIHINHKREHSKSRIENMLKEDERRFKIAREHKIELSEHRAITMMIIAFVLLTFKLWGIV